jgi:ABC-2 type transport system permease protein
MLAVFKRDLRSYFVTPIGYVFVAVFLAVNGGLFSLNTFQQGTESNVGSYFSGLILGLILVIPLLTMKIFSEEKKQKTEQLLMTSPISLGGMVFGKFLAAYTVFAGTYLVGSLQYLALIEYGPTVPVYKNGTLVKYASDYNMAPILGSMLAVLLIGAAFIAIGIFVSSLTENQFVSAIGTIVLMGSFLVIGMLNSAIPFAPVREMLSWLSVYSRYSNFTRGYLDFGALLYYTSISFVFLFLTVRIYEKRRWS